MVDVNERGLGPGRVRRVPQPPPFDSERLHGLPACPRLAGRGRSDQNQHPTAAFAGLVDRFGQDLVVTTAHVAGQCSREPASGDSRGAGGRGRMDLQVVRIPFPDRLPQPRTLRVQRVGLTCRDPSQLQQVHTQQSQLVGQRRNRCRRGNRAAGLEGLVNSSSPQSRSSGELGLRQPLTGQPVVQLLTKLDEGRLALTVFHNHLNPLPLCVRRCSSSSG